MVLEIEKFGFEINGLRHISGKESLEIMKEGGAILDVRPDYELTKLLNVEAILYFPYDEIKEHYQDLPRDTWLILADAVGLRSKEIALFLKDKGFSNILHLAGGVVEWERDGLPVTLDKSRRLTGSCICQLRRREIKKGKSKVWKFKTMSTITCPVCGHQETMSMPEDSCQYFYECPQCKTQLKPKSGDCCVFCSYGDTPCPPIQMSGGNQ